MNTALSSAKRPTDGRTISKFTVPVRYNECDTAGIVHHINYGFYLEEARLHFAKEAGIDFAKVMAEGFILYITDLSIQYKRPFRYGEYLDIYCWIDDLKSRGITFRYEICAQNSDTVHLTATVVLICINEQGLPARIPQNYYELLAATLVN